MNGYMELFLETGSPAFYMMAKQEGVSVPIAPSGAADRRESPTAEEETSPR